MHGASDGGLLLTGQTETLPGSSVPITTAGRALGRVRSSSATGARRTSPFTYCPMQYVSGAVRHKMFDGQGYRSCTSGDLTGYRTVFITPQTLGNAMTRSGPCGSGCTHPDTSRTAAGSSARTAGCRPAMTAPHRQPECKTPAGSRHELQPGRRGDGNRQDWTANKAQAGKACGGRSAVPEDHDRNYRAYPAGTCMARTDRALKKDKGSGFRQINLRLPSGAGPGLWRSAGARSRLRIFPRRETAGRVRHGYWI